MASADPRNHSGTRSPLSINTSNSGAMPGSRGGGGRQRFSYVETPVDMQEPQFGGNQRFFPGHTPIQEQNSSPIEGYHIQARETLPQTAYTTPQSSNMRTYVQRTSSPYGVPEPQGVHPAYYAPVVSQTPYTDPRSRSEQADQIPTSYPHSQPEPRPMNYIQRSSTAPIKPESSEGESYKKSPTIIQPDHIAVPYSPVFNPSSLAGPNGMAPEMHQPGQVAHPNMQMSESTSSKSSWAHSLCECNADVTTCVTGIFCPCILDSRTAYRMEKKGEHRDPTDLLGFKNCNTRCGIMSVFGVCGLFCIFPLTLRTRIRHAYKLQGNFLSDIMQACCCCCCVAIQNEREVREREERIRVNAGPAATQGYRNEGAGLGMVYRPGGGV